MRVLFITDPGIVGGATKSLVELTSTLKELYDVNICVCTSDFNELNMKLEEKGISSISCGHRSAMDVMPSERNRLALLVRYIVRSAKYRISTVKALRKIEEEVDLSKIDIIHTNSARNSLGGYLSQKYGIPHIVHLREFGDLDFNCWSLHHQYIKFLNKSTDVFISISNEVKKAWVKKGIQEEKIRVIYNGVDDLSIIPVDYHSFDSDVLKLVITGGIIPAKGQYQIIEAIGLLPDDIRGKVTLTMYGWSNEHYISKLMKRAKDLGVSNQIEWKGSSNDISSILCNYHIGLTCSKAEGFGRVTAEYMHAGLGVIVSDRGANPEIVDNNVNGMIYQYDNYQDLADKIEYLYRNRNILIQYGKNAKKKALTNYTKELNCKKIHELYCEIRKYPLY